MSVRVFYEILNQRGTPAMFTDTLANRPAFGYAGRLFVSTDSGQIFEDTGSAWTLVADAGVGGGTLSSVCLNGNTTATGIVITAGGLSTNSLTDTALTAGSILYAGSGGLISQSNSTFFWDATNNRLGIGINAPGAPLDIHATGTNAQFNGTGSNNAYLQFQNAGVSKWRIGNTYSAGANTFDIYNNGLANTPISISSTTSITTFSTTTNMSALLQTQVGIYLNQGVQANAIAPYTAISGRANGLYICPNSATGYDLIFPSSSSYQYTFPASTGTLALTSQLTVGTVTSVAALTIGTSGTDLSSSVANSTTTPVITLNVPTASATNRGVLSSADWTTFNNKQGAITLTTTGTSGAATFSANTLNIPNYGSALSGYLPLSGGTLTGTLNSNSLIYTTSNFKTDSSIAFNNVTQGGTSPSGLTNYSQLFFDQYKLLIRKSDGQVNTIGFPNSVVSQTWNFNKEGYVAAQNMITLNTGGILFSNSNSLIVEDYANFFWDNTNKKLGIGTSSPSTLLHLANATNPYLRIQNTTTNNNAYFGSDSSGMAIGTDSAADPIIFYTGASFTERMRITSGGVIQIANLAGTGSRAVLADASGNLSAPVSDISVKQNIKSIGYGLNEIVKMNPVWFDFIDEYKNYGKGRQNGNIAQEMQNIIPEAVFITPSTGKMGINYDQLHAVYIKAIQEQQAQIEELKQQVQLLLNK